MMGFDALKIFSTCSKSQYNRYLSFQLNRLKETFDHLALIRIYVFYFYVPDFVNFY